MYTQNIKETGFDFSLVDRNNKLALDNKQGSEKYKKTGTTICALTHKDGIIFAADSRATAGSIVMDLECIKVHELAPNIYAAGAGTAADLFAVINMMKCELEMQRMNTGTESRMSHVEHRLSDHLYKHMGQVGVALIVGGIDVKGSDICQISPHGNTTHSPYISMGSGSLAALSVLETRYIDGMTEEDAIELAADAIQAGIFYDLGSGSNINIFAVTKKECRKLYNYRVFNKKEHTNEELFKFPRGTTEVLSVVEKKWAKIEVEEVKDKMLLDI